MHRNIKSNRFKMSVTLDFKIMVVNPNFLHEMIMTHPVLKLQIVNGDSFLAKDRKSVFKNINHITNILQIFFLTFMLSFC